MNKNNELKSDLKAITVTLIFEASALNRDEKLGGNIPSIKKLTRGDKRTFSYISRVAMRHYLFETLSKNFNWTPAACFESGTGNEKVVQFDLRSQNILTHAELDAFGYMFTIKGQQSLTRKAAVGITKAVALEPWEGDMQFNANHDLARRCGANPNPVNKEEQMSYFKVTFTIDIDKLGYDEWWIENDKYDKTPKSLTLVLSKETEETGETEESKKTKKSKKESVTHTIEAEKEGERYIVKGKNNSKIGEIKIETVGSKKKAVFRLEDIEKKRRILQILEALKNSLIYHSSGENEGIVPQFMIAAGLKLPIPLFHSFVTLGSFESSILNNRYILSKDSQKLVYVYNPKNLVGLINTAGLYDKWDEFLKKLELL